MKPVTTRNNGLAVTPDNSRRLFLRNGIMAVTATGAIGAGIVMACQEGDGEEVTPAEDLMREHGILNRIMLVYDACILKLRNREQFQPEALYEGAQIIRTFIEDYHEQLEEKFVFPVFTNANKLVDLVQLLYIQHHAGKEITAQILERANAGLVQQPEAADKLASLLETFNRMYRPHEAREDTVLFPAMRKLLTRNAYYAMGEDFEKKEHELFGADGFESMVDKVAAIEKRLGIYDMALTTPGV